MHYLVLDTEQQEIIDIACDMALALLAARARRIDPDHIFSRGHEVQKQKLNQIRDQLSLDMGDDWLAFPPALRERIVKMAKALVSADDVETEATIWRAIVGTILGAARQPKRAPPAHSPGKGPLRSTAVPRGAPAHEGEHGAMRKVPDEAGG